MTRRGLLAGLGAGTAAIGGLSACTTVSSAESGDDTSATVGFHGSHQAGITTPQQDRLVFAAFDVVAGSGVESNRRELSELLATWTEAAEAMTSGRLVPGERRVPASPPADTGEAIGLPASDLTITVGFGPSLFDHRFGLAHRRPAALAELPHLAPENLDKDRSDGDIAVQVCAGNAQVAFHAVRNLARLGRGTVVARWIQTGFGRAASTSPSQQTPRNLFGFKDGTRNIHGQHSALARWVWVGDETDQPWMRDGSYLVARRIRQDIEAWDRDYLADQEHVFGRRKYSGAPLTGKHEFDTPDLSAKNPDGTPVVPLDAHIRLASRETNGGVQILRRAYNYDDGLMDNGELDAGLFMIIFQKDPRHQFVALQRRLGRSDALNEYIEHVGSGVYACPPGVAHPGRSWGDRLLA